MTDPIQLHPAVSAWFERRFPDGPTEPQRDGWPHIAAAENTLIAAPTGSGKTLAAFLMCINRLYLEHAAGHSIENVARVVYVSPLKALAVDIAENLQAPLQEIAQVAKELGMDAPEITVGVRTGDTTPAERNRIIRKPPNFVVTTPESLFLLVTSASGRETLRTVDTVIIDEIHAVARDKRGAHLALTLERLEALCEKPPTRIGLSATQRPIERVARLLVGNRPLPVIVDSGHKRKLDVSLELPDGELEAVTSAEQTSDILNQIAAHVLEHRTTLIFVNTRRAAERYAHQLSERLGEDVVAAHHGSLSKERRFRVESRLRAGELRALVATASLELGIDIGPVELVCQIGSPRSIATFLQRVGRSNHSRSGVPKGLLYPLTRDELVECTALLTAVHAGRLDAIELPRMPFDILAQQIVAEVGAQEWSTDDLYNMFRRAVPFTELTRAQFDEVLELVAKGIETGRGTRGRYVHHDAINGKVRGRKNARLAALTSGGAIPEIGDYRVVAEPDETFIGNVNEDWAVESMAGDIFLLGTHSWQIRRVEAGTVRVRDAGGAPPTIPFWLGEAPGRTVELSQEVSELRKTIDTFLANGQPDEARTWLTQTSGIEMDAASMVVDYIACGRAVLGVTPTMDTLVIERFFDETGGMQLVVHSPYGGRINRAFGLALRKKFCRTFDFELQAAASDDAIVLSLGPHHSFPLEEVSRYVNSHTLEDTLQQAILDAPMFISRWRWNLNRSLLILRFRNGRKNPPPIQRMEADDLMAAMFPQAAACQDNRVGPVEIPDQILVRQTLDDTLHEALDIDGLRGLLQRMESGAVNVHTVDVTEPSVLAHEILTSRPYTFLDDEETQNRRTNAVQLRRGLSVQLETIGQLDSEAIERVQNEITPQPETNDDLHDLLYSLVVTPHHREWAELFAELVESGRAQTINLDNQELWCVTEMLDTANDVLSGKEEAVAETVRGHLELSGITTVDALANAAGVSPSQVDIALASLQRTGFAMQGSYTPNAQQTEWVSRRLLARMHSYSRKYRRAGVEPASAQDFMRFLLRWQHVAPGTQLAGDEGLEQVVSQLQGWETAAAAWEPELLTQRMRNYDPTALDRLCHSGALMWLRLNPPARDVNAPAGSPNAATPISIVFREDFDWLLQSARNENDPVEPIVGATAEVIEALRQNGACFASDLEQITRRLPEDIERALWDGVARGLITADGFGAIRARVGKSTRTRPERIRRFRVLHKPPMLAVGRWSLVPSTTGTGADSEEIAEAVAELLLNRWGVVVRDLVLHESLPLPWWSIQRALRRFEDRGLVQGGRFVAGFSGEQYALPAAAEQLSHVRKMPHTQERISINGTDPLNLIGTILPGATVSATRTNRITYIDGVPETSLTEQTA